MTVTTIVPARPDAGFILVDEVVAGDLLEVENRCGEVIVGLVESVWTKPSTGASEVRVRVGGPSGRRDVWADESAWVRPPKVVTNAEIMAKLVVSGTASARLFGEWRQVKVIQLHRTNVTVEYVKVNGGVRPFKVPAWSLLRMAW